MFKKGWKDKMEPGEIASDSENEPKFIKKGFKAKKKKGKPVLPFAKK